ncbi:MAG TPA: DUF1326 domain-containing protein [Casimicrobiaceae bacterium]|jgi:hypothetical protein
MATQWNLNGRYYETCNCDLICPCVPTQMAGRPSKGDCTFAMGFAVERGRYGDVALDGLGFVVVGHTPEAMNKGNWSVGLVVDERATAEQREALGAIVSGTAGGPMAALSGLVTNFLGVESSRIRFSDDGKRWSVEAPGFVDMAAEAAMGLDPEAREPLHLDNTGHPAANRFALAHVARSHVHAFGLDWDDATGANNGQYAPFAWQGAAA